MATEKSTMSRTVIHAQITLGTPEAQRVFRRNFARVDSALMWLDTIYDRISGVEDFSNVFRQIETRITDALADIAQRKAQLRQLAEEEGIADVEVEHTQPLKLPADIQHPLSMQLMKLFSTFDDFLKDVQLLWILGILNRSQKKEAAAHARRHISEIALTIMRTNNLAQPLHKKAKAEGKAVAQAPEDDEALLDEAAKAAEDIATAGETELTPDSAVATG